MYVCVYVCICVICMYTYKTVYVYIYCSYIVSPNSEPPIMCFKATSERVSYWFLTVNVHSTLCFECSETCFVHCTCSFCYFAFRWKIFIFDDWQNEYVIVLSYCKENTREEYIRLILSFAVDQEWEIKDKSSIRRTN